MDYAWGQIDLAYGLKGKNLEQHAMLSVLAPEIVHRDGLPDTLTGVTGYCFSLEGG